MLILWQRLISLPLLLLLPSLCVWEQLAATASFPLLSPLIRLRNTDSDWKVFWIRICESLGQRKKKNQPTSCGCVANGWEGPGVTQLSTRKRPSCVTPVRQRRRRSDVPLKSFPPAATAASHVQSIMRALAETSGAMEAFQLCEFEAPTLPLLHLVGCSRICRHPALCRASSAPQHHHHSSPVCCCCSPYIRDERPQQRQIL